MRVSSSVSFLCTRSQWWHYFCPVCLNCRKWAKWCCYFLLLLQTNKQTHESWQWYGVLKPVALTGSYLSTYHLLFLTWCWINDLSLTLHLSLTHTNIQIHTSTIVCLCMQRDVETFLFLPLRYILYFKAAAQFFIQLWRKEPACSSSCYCFFLPGSHYDRNPVYCLGFLLMYVPPSSSSDGWSAPATKKWLFFVVYFCLNSWTALV